MNLPDLIAEEEKKFEKMLRDVESHERQLRVMREFPTDTEQYSRALANDEERLVQEKVALSPHIAASMLRVAEAMRGCVVDKKEYFTGWEDCRTQTLANMTAFISSKNES